MKVSCTAPAKVIVSGEHSVVYGYPALVGSVNVYSRVSVEALSEIGSHEIYSDKYGAGKMIGKAFSGPSPLRPLARVLAVFSESEGFRGRVKIRVSSDVPPASGMGSSASVYTALAKALLRLVYEEPPEEKIFNLAMEGERVAHVNPSGVDVAAALYGGLILFQKGRVIDRVQSCPGFLMLADSGIERNTSSMISKVASVRDEEPDLFNIVMVSIGELTRRITSALTRDLSEAGLLMTINHVLLSRLGVSNPRLDSLVWRSISAGAYGAKLTGGGGGGCVLILADENSLSRVEEEMHNLNAPTLLLKIVEEGARFEAVE
ncbi:MAG: mevalonate kinase [Thermoproteota archaeon]